VPPQVRPAMIVGMRSLEYLLVNDNAFTGDIPCQEIAELQNIKSVSMGNNEFENVEAANSFFTAAFVGRGVEVDVLGKGLLLYGTEVRSEQSSKPDSSRSRH
jgi:hypothetical protein